MPSEGTCGAPLSTHSNKNRICLALAALAALVPGSGCSLWDEDPWQQRDIIFSGRPSALDPDDQKEIGIYAVNLDGSGLVPILTSGDEAFLSQTPSPDGSKLVFNSSLGSTTLGPRLYVTHFDGKPMYPAPKVIRSDKFFVGYQPRWMDNDTFVYVRCPTCELGGTLKEGVKTRISDNTIHKLGFGDVALVLPGPDSTYALLRERDTPQFAGRDVVFRRGPGPGGFERILVEGGAAGLDWSPTGDRLAYVEDGRNIVVIDTVGVELARHIVISADVPADSAFITGRLAWLPDGTTMLANLAARPDRGSYGYTMIAIDLDDGSIREILDGYVPFETSPNPLVESRAAN